MLTFSFILFPGDRKYGCGLEVLSDGRLAVGPMDFQHVQFRILGEAKVGAGWIAGEVAAGGFDHAMKYPIAGV